MIAPVCVIGFVDEKRHMGPRIREDDKTVNPSFPPSMSVQYEGCFRRRRESIPCTTLG